MLVAQHFVKSAPVLLPRSTALLPIQRQNHPSEEGMLKTRREAVKWSLAPCNGNEDKNAIYMLLTPTEVENGNGLLNSAGWRAPDLDDTMLFRLT